jgi:protein-tyrosine phosphatase
VGNLRDEDLMPSWARRAGRLVLRPEARDDLLHEWRRRRAGEPPVDPAAVGRVLVICHGNLCRSPFAERLLAARVPALAVRSAGLHAVAGRPAEPAARRIAAAFGVDLEGHAAHRLDRADVHWADLILGMEGHHAAAVRRGWPEARPKAHLLGDFLASPPYRIEDPWGREDAVFRATFERIAGAVERLAARLAEGRP